MAGKKKTNYISYELEKLDKYISQLQDFLDKNPPNLAVDRVEHITTPRGGTTIKVIASIEQQVKAFSDVMKEMPRLLEDLNRIRREVDGNKKEVEVRGGHDIPGFMQTNEEDEAEETIIYTNPKKDETKDKFDDNSFYQEPVSEQTNTETKELPTSTSVALDDIEKNYIPVEEDEDDWLNEREDL